jgi:hypothetical protein
MDNLKLPAYPVTIVDGQKFSGMAHEDGFTKLELASLMIAQGLLSAGVGSNIEIDGRLHPLHQAAVWTAKAVLEEANK